MQIKCPDCKVGFGYLKQRPHWPWQCRACGKLSMLDTKFVEQCKADYEEQKEKIEQMDIEVRRAQNMERVFHRIQDKVVEGKFKEPIDDNDFENESDDDKLDENQNNDFA